VTIVHVSQSIGPGLSRKIIGFIKEGVNIFKLVLDGYKFCNVIIITLIEISVITPFSINSFDMNIVSYFTTHC
jgi:hypothetical protein